MEFSFEIPVWMNVFLESPMLIIAWAAFGMFFFTILFILIVGWINKIFKSKLLERVISVLGTTFIVTWLAGFVLMMLMFFSGVHPFKLILSWFLLLVTVLIFCIVEHRLILKWINSKSEIPLVKKKRT